MLEKVLWQWNKCDGGRLEELAAASMNSAHRWLVSGHSLLAEQQQAGAAVPSSWAALFRECTACHNLEKPL